MMRHLSCCALLASLAVGCNFDDDSKNNSDGGVDSGPADSGSGGDSSGGRDGGRGGTGASGGNASGGRGGSGAQGGTNETGGAGGAGAASGGTGGSGLPPKGGSGGSAPETGGVGGMRSGGAGGSPPPAAGASDEDAGVTDLALLELVKFEGVVSQAAVGQTIRATAQWRNASSAPIAVLRALITGRAPGASPAAGPYDDFAPTTDNVTVAPGDTLSITESLLPREVLGEWSVYPTYADGGGVYHDFPGTKFTMVTDPEYGSFDNITWPIANPSDSPNEDRRFAYACYKKLTTGDSARCTARYGIGTLSYQVAPDRLPMLQEECVSEGGILLSHACPTNQMLQLCWEDTRSPAYSYSCEYYGDPNNKSPQFPGAAPDIVYYNDNYLGRDPQP